MSRSITRRAAVLAGLGALSLAPTAALADLVTSTGYRADGSAYTGLVTAHGKTYLYEAGVLFKGGAKDYRGSRYFSTDDGHMATDEVVAWADGTKHHYGADGLLADPVPEPEPELEPEPEKVTSAKLGEKDLAAGWYTLTSGLGGRLDVYGGNATNGTAIDVYPANDSQAQRWRIMWDATVGAWRVEASSGVCELGNPSKAAAGDKAFLWVDSWQANGKGYPNQRWNIYKRSDGAYVLTSALNDSLALTAASGDAFAEVSAQERADSDGQLWRLAPCAGPSGWWQSADGKWHVNDPADAMMVRNCKKADPAYRNGQGKDDGWGSVYDFDAEGAANWHLPTYDDLPNGGAHGQGAAVPSITQGDRRQRSIMYALSRVGCPYRTGNKPWEFVCDGLTAWSYEKGAGEAMNAVYDDASFQWAHIKALHGDPWKADMNALKPGDLVFWGDESGKPLTYYAGAFGDYGYGNYHVGMYYGHGRMINARSAGVTDQTSIFGYEGEMGWEYLGGGDPYRYDTSRFGVPHV